MEAKKAVKSGKTALGIEFGSTRIKAILTNMNGGVIGSGGFEWENRLENGIWTYSYEDIENGLKKCFESLKNDVFEKYGENLITAGGIGISGMMHGYIALDKNGKPLVPFRTWRNSITEKAASILTDEFDFNIPQRWSIAHLYQAILNKEEHIKDIACITTLAGYINLKLTGKNVVGIGEASGMFPIDPKTKKYNSIMLEKFEKLTKPLGFKQNILSVLPEIMIAGKTAGFLTGEGALLLDSSGGFKSGVPLCPPEGDAGTGMTATNSVTIRTGNVSAGTSVFAMAVLEKELSKAHPEIDIVTTPMGDSVAMVHCNNCTSDLNAWIKLFGEVLELFGNSIDKSRLFETLFKKALEGDKDGGGLMSYNYLSGENIMGLNEGRPMFFRSPKADFKISDFMRTLLYSSLSTLKVGMDILLKEENVKIDKIYGHGGFFKTEEVGQRFLSAALDAEVTVMNTAGEGGAWGMALLVLYMLNKNENEKLDKYLSERIFKNEKKITVKPDKEDVCGFDEFLETYQNCISAEKAAINGMKVIS